MHLLTQVYSILLQHGAKWWDVPNDFQYLIFQPVTKSCAWHVTNKIYKHTQTHTYLSV